MKSTIYALLGFLVCFCAAVSTSLAQESIEFKLGDISLKWTSVAVVTGTTTADGKIPEKPLPLKPDTLIALSSTQIDATQSRLAELETNVKRLEAARTK